MAACQSRVFARSRPRIRTLRAVAACDSWTNCPRTGVTTVTATASSRGLRSRPNRCQRYPTGLPLFPMNTETPSPDLYLVVGYDGSPPSIRALDAAIRLLRGRSGRIDVVYVAHIPGIDMMSADAVGEMQQDFDEIERDLRVSAGEQLRDREERWTFERRGGLIGEALISAAKDIGAANPDGIVTIVVGSSSQALPRVVGAAAVALVRHSPVPVVVVP